MHTIRIIIADDHEIFLDGLELLLKKATHIQIAGKATNGQELVQLTRELQPDVVLTDIKMPIMDGIAATKLIRKEHEDVGVIALSMYEEDQLIVEMLEAGANGYLLKNASKLEILNAIETVSKGQSYYCNRTSSKLIKLIASSHYNPHRKPEKPILSDREIGIVKLVCQQYSNKEIADMLGLSIRTIEGHRHRIEEKIHAKNAAGIVLYGIKNGLHQV